MKGSLCGSGRLAAAGGAEPGGAGIGQGDFKASVKEAFFSSSFSFSPSFSFFFLFPWAVRDCRASPALPLAQLEPSAEFGYPKALPSTNQSGFSAQAQKPASSRNAFASQSGRPSPAAKPGGLATPNTGAAPLFDPSAKPKPASGVKLKPGSPRLRRWGENAARRRRCGPEGERGSGVHKSVCIRSRR